MWSIYTVRYYPDRRKYGTFTFTIGWKDMGTSWKQNYIRRRKMYIECFYLGMQYKNIKLINRKIYAYQLHYIDNRTKY